MGGKITENELSSGLNTRIDTIESNIIGTQAQTITLNHGQNLITTDRSTPFIPLNIVGNTIINLLGKDGNCEDTSKWSNAVTNVTVALDTSNFVFGTSSLKVTDNTTSAQHFVNLGTGNNVSLLPVTANHYYLLSGYLKVTNVNTPVNLTAVGWSGSAWIGSVSTPSVSSTSFTRVAVKFQATASAINEAIQINLKSGASYVGAGDSVYVDGVMLNEITSTDYNSLTVSQLMDKFPYVDSYQVLQNPMITAYGKNLLPPFSQWNLNSKTTINSPYSITLNADLLYEYNIIDISCLPLQAYSFSVPSDSLNSNFYWVVQERYDNTTVVQYTTTNLGSSFSFTTGSSTTYLRILTANSVSSGTFTYYNPMLNLGSTALPFEPADPSHMYFPVKLASGETLQEINGQWQKTKLIQDLALDGGYNIVLVSNATGYKYFQIQVNLKNVAGTGGILNKCVKYDGKILPHDQGTWYNDSKYIDQFGVEASGNNIWISVGNSDSGWGDSYTPTTQEIQAYFYGWRMYLQGSAGTIYNGTGSKSWAKIYCGVGSSVYGGGGTVINPVVSGSGVDNTCPTIMNDQGYTPYQLHYTLTTPAITIHQPEGSLDLHDGLNQVELGEGVIIRETVTPYYYSTDKSYHINLITGTNDLLQYRTLKILNVYKNTVDDSTNWIHMSNGYEYGKDRVATAPNAPFYDSTASYSVTYLAQPYQLSTNSPSQQGQYSTNDHTVLQNVVDNIEDVETRVSVLEETKANRQQPNWIKPTLLNGWTWIRGGYFKDEFGFVEIFLGVYGGTATFKTPIFNLPVGFRPVNGYISNICFSLTDGNMSDATKIVTGSFNIDQNTGNVQFLTGSNGYMEIRVRFKA